MLKHVVVYHSLCKKCQCILLISNVQALCCVRGAHIELMCVTVSLYAFFYMCFIIRLSGRWLLPYYKCIEYKCTKRPIVALLLRSYIPNNILETYIHTLTLWMDLNFSWCRHLFYMLSSILYANFLNNLLRMIQRFLVGLWGFRYFYNKPIAFSFFSRNHSRCSFYFIDFTIFMQWANRHKKKYTFSMYNIFMKIKMRSSKWIETDWLPIPWEL